MLMSVTIMVSIWEVYTPVEKKFGYYILPVLYNGQFITKFEAERIRKEARSVEK